jgi:hypothetical protein
MTRTIKAAILFICISTCALAVVFSPRETASETLPQTQILPVKNQQPHRGIWLRV